MRVAAMPKQHDCNRHGGAFETSPFRKFGEVSKAHRPLKTDTKPPLPRIGTTHAVNNSPLGVAADLPCSTSRGGARNSAYRESEALNAAQINNLIAGTAHADAIGLPFTRMTTIHWQAADIPLEGMAKATGRYVDLLTKTLARHDSRTAWLWVHEGGASKGGHCHLLLHIPAHLAPIVTARQRGWLRSITDAPYRRKVIRSDPIGGRLGLEANNPALHAVNLAAALGYVLKGAEPEAAAQFGLERLEPGGLVIGRRCSTSQNIGAKARKAHSESAQSEQARET